MMVFVHGGTPGVAPYVSGPHIWGSVLQRFPQASAIEVNGQTIDAIQYLANAIVARDQTDERKSVIIDAAGYRARRTATLEAMALRAADRARSGERVELEPMSAIERKVVHLRLQDEPGVATSSEGAEPNRYVVVHPEG